MNGLRRRYTIVVGLVIMTAGVVWLFQGHTTNPIDAYTACTNAGHPVSDTDPPVCTANNRNFVGPRASLAPASPPVANQPFSLLVHGDSHGDYPDRQEIIRTPANWQRYWRQVHSNLHPPPPLLPVNFDADMVIALSYGQKPTSGYDIKVSNVLTGPGGTIVDVVQTVPGEGCIVTAAQTNPYFIARTAKLPEPVSFRTIVQKHRCP